MGLALGSSQVMALGLGQLQVKSGLNQPLVAEIPIFAAMPGELDNLDIRLAPPEAFERVGLARPNYLTANLSFSIGKNARGQNVVMVTSTGKFSEPFLSFLIEANWGRGSVTKEYTALIDPPYIAKAIVRPMEAPTVAVAPTQYTPPPEPKLPPIVLRPEPEPQPEPAPVVAEQAAPLIFEPAPAPEPMAEAPPPAQVPSAPEPMVTQAAPVYFPPAAPTPANTPANTGAYGPVGTGKTLWSIAEEVRPDESVTVKQMMVALLRANPDAFEGENVNKLKRGSVLRIPGRDEATILTSEQAAALVAEQSGSLRSQRLPVPQPTETVADTSPEPVAAMPAATVSKPKPKPAVVKPTVASKPKARLEIVPPSSKTSGGKAAQSGASSAAGGAELRAELTQAREDIAVRDSEITELKSRVTDLESQQTDAQKLIEMKDSQLKALQDELGKQQTAAPAVQPAPQPVKPAAVDTSSAQVAAPAAADPWYMNPMLHYGAGGLLLLGGLVWFFRRSRNKSEEEEPVVSRRISDDADLQASLSSLQDAKSAHQDNTAPAKPVNLDADTKANVATSKPGPVAPIEEPELVSLRNQVRSRPQDLEAHLALLRYHYQRGDSKDFEAAAQTMRTHVSTAQDPRWREAVVMGVALLPGHALFNQAGWNVPKFESTAKPIPPVPVAAEIVEPEPSFLSQKDMAELDNLEAVSIAPLAPIPAAPATIASAQDEPDEIMLMSESDFVALDNMPDIHRSESELMDVDAASSTKIELARAYLEIGDVEGARSMLEEVAASGSAPARAMAQRIMNEIG